MKSLKEIIDIAQNENRNVTLVTHDGICHTDEVLVTSLLRQILLIYGIECNIVRTRNENNIPKDDPLVIVYDVFGGELDHHKEDLVERGRALSSIGKVWGWAKDVIMNSFGIDEQSWKLIDNSFIMPIDITDNFGLMNPFTFYINSIKDIDTLENGQDWDSTFQELTDIMGRIIFSILKKANIETKMHKLFAELPTITYNGLVFKINENDNFIRPDNYMNIDGYIWKDQRNYWSVSMSKFSDYELRKGMESGNGVIFTHKNGFIGEIETINDLGKILVKKG